MSDDDALTGDIYQQVAEWHTKPLPKGESRADTPHTRLKRACRRALHEISQGRGCTIPIQNIRAQIPGTQRTYQTGRPGAADDIWVFRGIAFGIEYKAGTDRQSERQAKFQQIWERAGGVYILARSPEQLTDDIRTALTKRASC